VLVVPALTPEKFVASALVTVSLLKVLLKLNADEPGEAPAPSLTASSPRCTAWRSRAGGAGCPQRVTMPRLPS